MFKSLKVNLPFTGKKEKENKQKKKMSSKYFGTAITEKFLPDHMQVYICLIFFILKGRLGSFL